MLQLEEESYVSTVETGVDKERLNISVLCRF